MADRCEDFEDKLQECLFVNGSSNDSLNLGEVEPNNLYNIHSSVADEFVLVIFVVGNRNVFILNV